MGQRSEALHPGHFLASFSFYANGATAVESCGPQSVSLTLFEPQKTCFVWH